MLEKASKQANKQIQQNKKKTQPNTKMFLSTALRGGTFLFCVLCTEAAIKYYLAVPTEKIPDIIKVKISLKT